MLPILAQPGDSDVRPIERAYRLRAYLTPAQARLLRRLFGARRRIWNWALSTRQEARSQGERLTWVDLSKRLTVLKQSPEFSWLQELPRDPLDQTLRDQERGISNFFAGRARFPRRKRYGSVSSARFTLDQRRQQVRSDPNPRWCRVSLPGLGEVKLRLTEPLAGRLRSITLSQDAAGRFFAAITADLVPLDVAAIPEAEFDIEGADAGFISTVVTSNGYRIDAERALKRRQQRLCRYQRSYSRQMDAAKGRIGLKPKAPIPKGTRIPVSNRMRATARRIGTLHARVADARRNHLHQASNALVRRAHIVALENLSVKGLCRSLKRAFRRSAHDAGLGELQRQIVYKAGWYGRRVEKVDRFFPSSQLCACCGHRHRELKLNQRRWTCPDCGTNHDRDENAAVNIESEARRILGMPLRGSTRRSRESDAREEAACAADRTASAGQPTSSNREFAYRAERRSPERGGMEPPRDGVG